MEVKRSKVPKLLFLNNLMKDVATFNNRMDSELEERKKNATTEGFSGITSTPSKPNIISSDQNKAEEDVFLEPEVFTKILDEISCLRRRTRMHLFKLPTIGGTREGIFKHLVLLEKIYVDMKYGSRKVNLVRITGVLNEFSAMIKKMDYNAEINVDAKYHKRIIGKRRLKGNKLKPDNDVIINNPDKDKGPTTTRFEGNEKVAKEELESVVPKMQDEKEMYLIIANRFYGQLIGHKGKNIQKIREDFANVQISFLDLDSHSDVLKLHGLKDDVDKCMRAVNKIYKDVLERTYQVKVPIFKQFQKYIIGRGGATIQNIRKETETWVSLAESKSDLDVITIVGKKKNVEVARKRIHKIVDDAVQDMKNQVVIDCVIEHQHHGAIIGIGGSRVQKIRSDFSVQVDFPAKRTKGGYGFAVSSEVIRIIGRPDNCEAAKQAILNLVDIDIKENMVKEEAEINHGMRRMVIGQRGTDARQVSPVTSLTAADINMNVNNQGDVMQKLMNKRF